MKKHLSGIALVCGVVVAAAGLGGCFGYTPLYAPVRHDIASVQVAKVTMVESGRNMGERRVAQLVRNHLLQVFYGEEATYKLSVAITESQNTLAVRRDASDLRREVELSAKVVLSEGTEDIFKVTLTSNVAYNVENSPFGTDSGREQAREAASQELSNSITRRVSMFLRNHTQQTAQ